jgi:ribonuclease P protein component
LNTKEAGFSRQKRLLRPEDYKKVFEQPLRSTSSYFKVLARPNEKLVARLGVIVAKKALRSAVTRNRVKRLVRESFRMHQRSLVGLDVVVLLRKDMNIQRHPKTPTVCLEQHWKDLASLWQRD